MSSDSAPLFHSSATPGYSSRVSNDPRHVVARKRERDVQVQFAAAHCTVQTPEGPVHASPGDAVVTDSNGEQWRVSRARFAEKYRPVAPARAGEAGRYTSPICISAESHASRAEPLKTATRSAIALILEEHQGWHMLVKPHHLPLA